MSHDTLVTFGLVAFSFFVNSTKKICEGRVPLDDFLDAELVTLQNFDCGVKVHRLVESSAPLTVYFDLYEQAAKVAANLTLVHVYRNIVPSLLQDTSISVTTTTMYSLSRVDGIAMMGDTIDFVITATNDGNVDLNTVSLTDETFKNDTGTASCTQRTPDKKVKYTN